MEHIGPEKRKFPRALFPCRVVVGHPHKIVSSYTENISEDGIKVVLDIELEPLSIVGLELFMEKGEPILCKGKVVWVEAKANPAQAFEILYHTGIALTDISHDDKRRIKHLVEKFLEKEKDA